ncbi:MAG: ribosome biogenesis GTP-binding protein YihA/YsxC [Bacteroidota bacterium]
MIIRDARFIISNTDPSRCPAPDKPEFAFIGRSNVGKSSLINMLVKRDGLAKTSSTPGKTQVINHFLINDDWYLVDLPGYGFAKTGRDNRDKWLATSQEYLRTRPNLMCIMLLIDSRIELKSADRDFMQWLGEIGLPFVIVFTKADKQSRTKTNSLLAAWRKSALESWEELPQQIITSAEDLTGREELLNFIDETKKMWVPLG